MKHIIRHGLSGELAQKATHRALESYEVRFAQYEPQIDWRDAQNAVVSFSVKGVSLSGDVALNSETITIDLSVPFLLKPFKSKAIAVVEAEIHEWIARAKAGELD